MLLTFNTDDIYNLEPYAMRGGSRTILPFNFYDNSKQPLDITSARVIWTLSEFGQADFTILTKEGVLSGETSCSVILESEDTRHLEGKFVHQITIIDYKGYEYIPCQGVIKINRNNNNN